MKKFLPSGYFEAKLQVRPKDESHLEWVKKKIKKNNIEIVDINELKEGYDVYINSADFAIKIGKQFRNEFNIKPKVSRSLTGEDKAAGKRIYKITVLLKKEKK